MVDLKIPPSVEEVTPQWLTEALRSSKVIRESTVTSFDGERLGVGQGFTGQVARLRLTYDSQESGAPLTLIAKFPATDPPVRAALNELGIFEREVRFYGELAPKMDLSTPRCFYRASDKEAEDLALKENKSDIIAGADLTGYAPEVSRVLIDLAQSDTNKESWYLARSLVVELKKKIKLLRVSHRYAGFAVLKSPNVPSALIELGYLSNRIDEKNLKSAKYRKGIGRALLRATDKYFERKDLNNRS